MHGMTDQFIPTRQTLLSRLKDWSDHDSWKEFFEIYWKLIYHVAIKAGLTDAEAQDVVQETIVALSKSMPDFKYDPAVGSFKGYLLTLTTWRIKDQLRRRLPMQADFRSDETGTGATAGLADPNGFVPETYWNEEWEKNLMDVARERVKRRVDPKHYQIFDLHVTEAWPASKVAEKLGVTSAFVHLVKYRIARSLKKEIENLQAEDHHENDRQ
jgi:RNA polymerase sigma-70 factor (ECF subfamily)